MQKNFKPVRIGIIGCGGYADQLIRRIFTLPRHLHLVAATSRQLPNSNADFLAAEGVQLFQTLDELLDFAGGQLDVILNPTPIHIHKSSTLRCLEAGFPVWLEKPPVASLADLEILLDASRASRQSIDVCFNSFYGHNVQRLKSELVEGRYGAIRRVRGIGGWPRSASYFNRADWSGKLKVGDDWVLDGTINNPLAHLICNNLYFAAGQHHALADVSEVEAHLWHANPIESEDTSALRLHTAEGVEILSHLTLCPERLIPPTTVIDTERATLTLLDFETVRIEWHTGEMEDRLSYKENRIEMLEELAIRFRSGEPALCPLARCRSFVETVESAFQQVLRREAGIIPAINRERITTQGNGEETTRQIIGINALFGEAHRKGKLLTEI